MFIYSVTIHIDADAEQAWVQFMSEHHISDVLAAGYFISCSMRRQIVDDEEECAVYNMQYSVESEEKYFEYLQKAAPKLQADLASRFTGKYSASRCLYKVITEVSR